MINIKLSSDFSKDLANFVEPLCTKEEIDIEISYKIKVKGKVIKQGRQTYAAYTKNIEQKQDIIRSSFHTPPAPVPGVVAGPVSTCIELVLLEGHK